MSRPPLMTSKPRRMDRKGASSWPHLHLAKPILPWSICNFRPHRSVRDEGSANQQTYPGLVSCRCSRARDRAQRARTFRDLARGERRRLARCSLPRKWDGEGGRRRVVLRFSPDYLPAKFCNRQTMTSGWCSLRIDQYLPSPRPSGGSLVIIGPGNPRANGFLGT
jgi:hypothetical protein